MPEAQLWNAGCYAGNARFVADLGEPLIDWMAPRAGLRVLDLGCGDGALTEKLVAAGCDVTGVDASAELLEAARARGLRVRRVDGERLDYQHEFDAVFSNAALHWMRDADAVIAGVARALVPGGRLVAEMGGAGNVAHITGALHAALAARGKDADEHHPWYFPSAEEYAGKLERQGFEVQRIELFQRPTPLPGDMRGWLATFAGSFTAALPAEEREQYLAEVAERLEPELRDADGTWHADYVRLRFAAFSAA